MKKLNYVTIDDGFLFKLNQLEIRVTVQINQAWYLKIDNYSFKFKDTKEAISFLNLMKQLA